MNLAITMRSRMLLPLLGGALALAVAIPQPASAALAEADQRPALQVNNYAHVVFEAVAQAGKRLVAVGERGMILLSDDQGAHWREARVPVSVTLTAVEFPTPQQGWAVGHYGTVLHSSDGGESWQVQLDGVRAAQLTLDEVQARAAQVDANDRAFKRELRNAKLLVSDGPDKPFLSLHFFDSQHGIVIGAYDLILGTDDGGKSWHSLGGHISNPGARHFYAMAEIEGSLYIVGEQGRIYRSDDRGGHFERLNSPYEGSFFTVTGDSQSVVVAGLRGNAFRSTDKGQSWSRIKLPNSATVLSSTMTADGELLLATQTGKVLSSHDLGRTLAPLGSTSLPPVTGLVALSDHRLVVTSLQGLRSLHTAQPVNP